MVDPGSVHSFWLRQSFYFAGSSNAKISGVRDSAAKLEAVGSTTSLSIRQFETPVRRAWSSPTDHSWTTFQTVDSEVEVWPQVNIILLGE